MFCKKRREKKRREKKREKKRKKEKKRVHEKVDIRIYVRLTFDGIVKNKSSFENMCFVKSRKRVP